VLGFGGKAPGSQGEWIASGGHTAGGSVRSTARGASNKSFMVVIDLGQDCSLAEISWWFYPGANTNWHATGCFLEDGTQTAFPSGSVGAVGWQHYTLTGISARYILLAGDCNLTGEQLVRCSDITITPN
jgi:hypothetical protein